MRENQPMGNNTAMSAQNQELLRSIQQSKSIRETRYPCLFPGMLRILFPEKSFVPLNVAVRVANLSCGGAMVELHGANLDEGVETFKGCYFELRIAVAGTPPIYGVVARSDLQEDCGILGLRFHRPYPELIGSLIHQEGDYSTDPTALPMPVLDPFAPISDESLIIISGHCVDATEVVVISEDGIDLTVPVHHGRFSAKLELTHQEFNNFQIIARAGQRQSPPIPLTVAYVPLPSDDFHFHTESSTDMQGNYVLTLDYMGAAYSGGRMLAKFVELTPGGKHARISIKLTSSEEYPEDIALELRREAESLKRNSRAEE